MNKSKKDKSIVTFISLFIPLVITFILIIQLDGRKYDYSSFEGVRIVESLLGVWSTLLGFMITAVSILITLGGNSYLAAFRGSSHYDTVIYTQILTCLQLFSSTLFGTIIICLNIWNKICMSFFLYLLFSSFLSLAFSIFFFFFLIFKSR